MSFFDTAAAAWINAGGDPAVAPIMAAIAVTESSNGTLLYGDQAYSGTGAPSSFGAWQIHTFDSSGPVNVQPDGQRYNEAQLASDLDYNAKAAVNIYQSQGLAAWSTFTSGAWANNYPGGKAAALQSLLASPVAGTAAAKRQETALGGAAASAGPKSSSTTSQAKPADPGFLGVPGAIANATSAVVDEAGTLAQELFLGTLAVAFIAGGLTWLGAIDAPKISIGVPAV